jgi:nucleolar complex protein 2
LLDKWAEDLATKPSVAVVAEVVQGFRSAVLTISPSETEQPAPGKGKKKLEPKAVTGKYIVEGSSTFNGVVRLCLTGLLPAFNKILGFGSETSRRSSHPSKAKGWRKLHKHLKIYTQDLVTLMTSLTTGSVLAALLKHVQNMVPYFVAIPKSSKLLTKCLVNLWSSANEETVRVLAFMCLIRMTRYVFISIRVQYFIIFLLVKK